MTKKKVKLAVLGAGGHSRSSHGRALRELVRRRPEEVELSAVCDLDAARAEAYAGEFGFDRSFTKADRMLEEVRPDGLLLITPVALTEEIARRFLPQGVPLLIEKPPGRSASAALGLWRLARETGCPHMISFNRRFHPAIVRACEWMREQGTSGRPLGLVARMIRARRMEPTFITETAVHLIDTSLSLLGRPLRVDSAMTKSSGGVRSYQALVHFESGASAALTIAPDSALLEETYEILGDGWKLGLDVRGGQFTLVEGGKEVGKEGGVPLQEEGSPWEENEDGVNEMAAFVEAVRGDRPFSPDLSDGVFALQVAEAIRDGGAADLGLTH